MQLKGFTMFYRLPAIVFSAFLSVTVWAEEPLFRFQGMDYKASDLSIEAQQSYYELQAEHHLKLQQLVDSAALQIYFEELAKKQNQPVEIVMEGALGASEPSEAELKKFYEENKNRIKGEFEQLKPQLVRFLKTQEITANKEKLLAELKAKQDFEFLIPEPEALPVQIATEGYPQKGDSEAPVHIVEFADYQCPHCKKASEALDKVVQEYPGKVKLTFMDYPINRSGISRLVAEGAVCADEQGKYWAYHDQAFTRQATLDHNSPQAVAAAVGLDIKAFKTCMDSDHPKQKVEKSKQEARRLALDSTPAVFVNGKRVRLYDLNNDLRNAIDKALAEIK
jgi:protein-disulfide isomerase